MQNLVSILWLFFTTSTLSTMNDESAQSKPTVAMLELKIQLPAAPIYSNRPLPAKAILLNRGHAPVLVNTRLSVGYKTSLSRELYADILNLDTGMPANYSPLDINRDFSGKSDYKMLSPGDSVMTTFNLLEYYPLKKAGHYELILHYQSDEELAETPANIFKGVVSSSPIRFKILVVQYPEGE
jgi:hypothetical protein